MVSSRRFERSCASASRAARSTAPTVALSAAVRPPRLEYQIATLPNGLTVVMEEDHSTPIVHAQLWYHVGSRNEKPGRTGFAHLFEHLMFKGSKNVEPEGHTSMIASIGGQSNAYTQDDVTVFWETRAGAVPAAGALARSRSDGDAADRQGHLRERARRREGRAPDADRQPAVRPAVGDHLRSGVHRAPVQAPDDRQHERSRGRVGRRRPGVLQHLLRAGERDAGARRRLRLGAGAAARHPVSRPRAEGRASRCRATSPRSRRRRARSA